MTTLETALLVAGSARDQSRNDASRLSGDFAATASGDSFSQTFVMERTTAGTPSTLGDTWTLALRGSGPTSLDGTMTLTLAVGADGTAATTATTIERTGGGTAYSVGAGTCDVAPSGGMHCSLRITDPPFAGLLWLHGVLDAAGKSGQGGFAIGKPPSVSEGRWTANR